MEDEQSHWSLAPGKSTSVLLYKHGRATLEFFLVCVQKIKHALAFDLLTVLG